MANTVATPARIARLFFDERRGDERQDEQRYKRPAEKIQRRRTVPGDVEFRWLPEPEMFHMRGARFERQIKHARQPRRQADEPPAVIFGFAPRSQAQPRDPARIENGDDPQ